MNSCSNCYASTDTLINKYITHLDFTTIRTFSLNNYNGLFKTFLINNNNIFLTKQRDTF